MWSRIIKYKQNIVAFVLLQVAASILYGLSLVNSWNILAFLLLCLLFALLSYSFIFPLKQRLVGLFIAQTLFMFSACWWMKNIDALGWANIFGVSPQIWLMFFVFVVSLICAAVVCFIYWVLFIATDKWQIHNSFLFVYLWGVSQLLVELTRSLVFSLIAHGNGMSIAPTWNLFSSALITATNFSGYLGRVFGFWGTSFVVYVCAGFTVYFFINIRNRSSKDSLKIILATAVCITFTFALISYKTSPKKSVNLNLVAVHQNLSEPDYLQKMYDKNDFNSKDPTIVGLPEYSNLIHPLSNTGLFNFGYDARYTFPEKYKNSNVYFVGTEDEYNNGIRYVENYIVNGQLQKINRKVKKFLIPGGEYTPAWITKVLKIVDKQSVDSFQNTRERHVINVDLLNDVNNLQTKNMVIIGACSDLLTPYHFQKGVKNGGLVFVNNVSFEQFTRASEYELYAERFASFTSRSLERPMVIGARNGSAYIYDRSGNVSSKTADGFVQENITVNDSKNIYSILGDSFIIFILFVPAIILFLIHRLKTRRS